MKTQDWTNRKSEPYQAKIVRTLPLGGKIKRVDVVVHGNLVITDPGAGAAGTFRYGEHFAALVKRIRVRTARAAGSTYPDGILRDYSFRGCLHRASTLVGHLPYLAGNLLQLGAGADSLTAGTKGIYFTYPIYFAQPDMKRPIETALNSDGAYSNIQIELDMAAPADIASGSTMTWNFTGLSVDFIDHREGVDGDTYVVVEEQHETLIPGAQLRFEDKNMDSDGALLDVLILAQTGSESGTPVLVDTILNEVVISGDNLDYDLYARDIRQAMYDNGVFLPNQAAAGLFLAQFCSAGMMTKRVMAQGMQMKLDVSNPSGANNDSLLVLARRVFQPTTFSPIQFGQKARASS